MYAKLLNYKYAKLCFQRNSEPEELAPGTWKPQVQVLSVYYYMFNFSYYVNPLDHGLFETDIGYCIILKQRARIVFNHRRLRCTSPNTEMSLYEDFMIFDKT